MRTAIVLNSETMGEGDQSLGKILIGAFLKKIWLRADKPDTLLLYNSGVKLLSKEAGLLDVMTGLEESGVDIIACGTCLDFYDMKSSLKVGRISNMEEIVQVKMAYDKVITL